MKTTLIASAMIALSMAASGNALAQRGDYGNDRYDNDRNGRVEHRSSERYDNRYDNNRYDRNERHDRYYNAQHYRRDDMRGGGPRHDWRRGQRLHQEYRSQRYVVSDWHARRLSAPPRGYHWVHAGNDYVLAAIATGIIAQVLLSN